MFTRARISSVLAELFGTFVLVMSVTSISFTLTQIGTVAKSPIPFFGPATAGAVLALMVLIIGKISGAHINPAVTFGLWSVRKIKTFDAALYILFQLLAGSLAIILTTYLFSHTLPELVAEPWSVDWRVFTAEGIGTFIFTFGIAAALSQKFEDFKLAAAIGISLFAGATIASMGSLGLINPAVAVGVGAINVSYFVAPLVGSLIAFNLYELIFSAGTKPQKTSSVKISSKKSTTKKSTGKKTKK